MRLLFKSVGKEEIGLSGDKLRDRNFFHAHKNIGGAQVGAEFDAFIGVFLVAETPHGAWLNQNSYLRIGLCKAFALFGTEGNAFIDGYFAFANEADGELMHS